MSSCQTRPSSTGYNQNHQRQRPQTFWLHFCTNPISVELVKLSIDDEPEAVENIVQQELPHIVQAYIHYSCYSI
ncbi:hypothetical protein Hanom_Chr01g00039011 [Helianthus anomalus]